MTKAEKLRSLLREKTILQVVGAHNALGARLIEKHGFDAVWASGFEIATAHGVPDANILTMTENLQAAININSATSLPVICDCDTGYGNAVNVMHMIRRYEEAGMAAVVIEDKRFPKLNSFVPGRQELASIEEFVGKLEAAQEARSSASTGILIMARIEALIAGWGMEEALRRATAYWQAGADGIVIHSKSSLPDEVLEFSERWRQQVEADSCPLVAIPTSYYHVEAGTLAEAGFKIVIYANHGIRATVRALDDILEKISVYQSTQPIQNQIASMEEIFALQGMTGYRNDAERYTQQTGPEVIRAIIPAAADHRSQPELSALLRDQPLCMLEIGGKTILDRQLELLKSVGIQEVKVVVGDKKEKVDAKSIQRIENLDYKTKSSAHSVMLGLAEGRGKHVVCYSDIIFDKHICELLIQSPYPITLVIDRAFRTLPRRDKKSDLVSTKEKFDPESIRRLELETYKKVVSIGKNLNIEHASYEFIGLMLLSDEGLKTLRAAWKEALDKYRSTAFYEASDGGSASMTDLLQFVIDRGTDVYGLVVEHGWSEIFSLNDVHRLNNYFQEKNQKLDPVYS